MFMMYVDLDELPTLFDSYRFWSLNKLNIAAFHRNDHHGEKDSDLSSSIRRLVNNHSTIKADGPIRLLTHFRYFGYVFNPLSIYYCYDANDKHVTHVVSEVTNTPWKEQHCYVLNGHEEDHQFVTQHHKKEFHVSPFLDMNMDYHWKIGIPADDLYLSIDNKRKNENVFHASMRLKKESINQNSLRNVLINFPLMTMKVTSAIHLQALALWLKGIKYVPHPKNIQAK